MAREALARVLAVNPDDRQLKGALRYCDGHLHRINGEARKAHKQDAEAQHEFTDAVSAFREAAELRPNWPDPFLGLMRTFIYGLEDVDRGADALKQAQRLGYTAGRARRRSWPTAIVRARDARAHGANAERPGSRTGIPQTIGRGVPAGDRSLFEGARLRGCPAEHAGRAARPRTGRTAKRRIVRPRSGGNTAAIPNGITAGGPPMTATYTVAAERQARRKRHWTDRIGLSVLSLAATSCVAMLAITLAYAGRISVFEQPGHARRPRPST